MLHDRPRRLRGTTLLIVIPALALMACAPAAKQPPPSAAAPAGPGASTGVPPAATPSRAPIIPAAANALIAVGRTGAPDLEVLEANSGHSFLTLPLGAPDPTWGHVLSTSRDGKSTIVRNDVLEDTGSSRELRLDGEWRLPTIGQDPIPGGRSSDGSTYVLVQPRTDPYATSTAPSRFAVIRAPIPPSVAPLQLLRVIELPGAFEYDTMSANGSILYVIEHLDDQAGGAYQVRSIDTASGRMDDVPVVDKANIDETMAGHPITQLRQDDGMVYTLYRGTEHPFVHALSSTDKWALCIDLPATGQDDATAADDWALTTAGSGKPIFAINATLGLVSEFDRSELAVKRLATFPKEAAAAPRMVLAKFGHVPGGPLGHRAAVTPSGGTIVAGGRDGLVGVRSKDLSVSWRALPDEAIRAVGMTTDGSAAYVLTGSGRIVALSTTDGSVLGDVPGGAFDRLVAVLGG
jgi:hypothetical protein